LGRKEERGSLTENKDFLEETTFPLRDYGKKGMKGATDKQNQRKATAFSKKKGAWGRKKKRQTGQKPRGAGGKGGV